MHSETRELREKATGELEEDLLKAKQVALDIRVKAPTNEGENPYLLRGYRRRIARITTILHERAQDEKKAAAGAAAVTRKNNS